ncbi:MAG: metalloregulator ArsR/SmtB family transcription factor [Gemmatimonadales bacterium]|jgi:ArsR family transcriptional regulator
MPRTLAVPKAKAPADRQRGERCCGPSAKPAVRTAKAERLTADLEILAHPVRLQLLDILLRNEGRVCVCDLDAAVPVKQPTVSHHLKLLREAGLVSSEKHGVWAYYRVRRDALAALRARIVAGLGELA